MADQLNDAVTLEASGKSNTIVQVDSLIESIIGATSILPSDNNLPMEPIINQIIESTEISDKKTPVVAPSVVAPVPAKSATDHVLWSNHGAIDVIYRQLITGTDILTTIHSIQVKGFTASDIPGLMLAVLTAYNNNNHVSLSIDDVQLLLERVYTYLVTTYNLITPENRADCFTVYVLCLKLALSTPKLQNEIKSCFSFFGCAKRT